MEKYEKLLPDNSVIVVAHKIIAECDAELGEIISNLKLQKMLYYLQGFFIAAFDKKLFEEPIVAWQYGPVVEVAYHHFKTFEKGAIRLEGNEKMVNFSDKEYNLFKAVMEEYGQFSAIKLMEMTHEEPPWKETFEECPGKEITYERLKEYFKTQIE
jgi:uncharacterized phage-associated protein